MSFSARTVVGAARTTVKTGDAWLARMGIDVFGLRKTATPATAAAQPPPAPPAPPPPNLEKEYDAALSTIREAGFDLEEAHYVKHTATLALKPAFAQLPRPPDPKDVSDFAQALADIQPKLEAARRISATFHFTGRNSMAEAIAGKAQVNARIPGLAFPDTAGLVQAVDEAKGKRDRAVAAGDFVAATAAVGDIEQYSRKISQPYETTLSLDRNKPLFAKAEAILSARKAAGPVAPELGPKYAGIARNLDDALTAQDFDRAATLLNEKIGTATAIIRQAHQPAAQKWWDDNQQDPTEVAKFRSMQKVRRASEKELIERYRNALADGHELNGITISEVAAIDAYSRGIYKWVNLLLREPETAKLDAAVAHATRAVINGIIQCLAKLPKYNPAGFPVFRWENPFRKEADDAGPAIDHLKSRYAEGKEFVIPEVWSTGGGGGADVDGPASAEIAIWGDPKGSRAKDVSMLTLAGKIEGGRSDRAKLKGQAAGEVLFPPGTKFRTIRVTELKADGTDRLQRRNAEGVDTGKMLKYRIEVVEVAS